jgi:hypothetical protein
VAERRALQVIRENVNFRPDRYTDYRTDLVNLLNDALTGAGGGLSSTQRRQELSDAVKAKASQIARKS